MAKGPEGKFIDKIHRQLNPLIYKMSNTNTMVGGIPDQYYEGSKNCIWIEYKSIPKLPTELDLTKKHLTPLQLKWLRRAAANHGNVAVIVGIEATGEGLWFKNLSWEMTHDKDYLMTYLQTPKDLAMRIANYTLKKTDLRE